MIQITNAMMYNNINNELLNESNSVYNLQDESKRINKSDTFFPINLTPFFFFSFSCHSRAGGNPVFY